jgi:raffinose/stachyose/melibiose transport system substrate-binding protein
MPPGTGIGGVKAGKMKAGLKSMLLAAGVLAGLAGSAHAGSLKIESWRSEHADIWNDKIIPAFNAKHPDIQVEFATIRPKNYDRELLERLENGKAGDLITCRPFDPSLDLFKRGHLAPLNDLKGMEEFSAVARSAWTTDDGKTTFCMPVGSVIHGFLYNKEAFEKLGLSEPKTEEEFFTILEKIKADGTYIPLDMGTADQWEAATMGFQNIGPNYWKGEEGRAKLIKGEAKLTDPEYVNVWKTLAKWAPYMGDGYKAQTYPDSQNLFSLGKAAVYPAGSWDIPTFRSHEGLRFGAFKPPVPSGTSECYISDHTDIGLGMNAKSPNQAEARVFLEWLASDEFANIFANALPGFFPLSKSEVKIEDEVAQTFVSWREECNPTIRNSYQILSRGMPVLEKELWNVSAQVINGTLSPEDAGKQAQEGLAKWYGPQK